MPRITEISRWINTQLKEFNLFESEESRTSVFHLRTAIISTRIYFIMVILSVTILITFTSLENQIETVTVSNPSQTTYENLLKNYPTTLQCPCKKININYGSFMSISVRYHSICLSSLVSNAWINMLYSQDISYYFPIDFRSSANGHFRLLASLCSLTMQSISEDIDKFLSNYFLTPYVLSNSSFDEQILAESSFVQLSTGNSFQRLLRLIRAITYTNLLQTALQTSRSFSLDLIGNETASVLSAFPLYRYAITNYCHCDLGQACSLLSTFYIPAAYAYSFRGVYFVATRPMATVPGFKVGCYPIEALFQSTLECFFNSSCFNTVLRFFSSPTNQTFEILNSSQTRFSPKDTIGSLVNESFLEDWNTTKSYTSYYEACAPMSCIYTFSQRNSALYVILKLLGLYGGLSIALRLIVLFSISSWRNRINRPPINRNINQSYREHLRTLWVNFQTKLIKLNLFKTAAARHDQYELITTRITTRIYISVLILSIIIIFIYTISSVQQQTITIKNPSQLIYNNIFNQYPLAVKCPCNKIAIGYGSFISFSPKRHPVCESLFVSDEWIISTRGYDPIEPLTTNIFQQYAPFLFKTLSTLCLLTQDTISDSWEVFRRSSLITNQLLPYNELLDRLEIILQQFIRNTINEFTRTHQLMLYHIRTMFLEGSNAKFNISHFNKNDIYINFTPLPLIMNSCSCAINDTCKSSVHLNSYIDPQFSFEVPGLVFSCSISQAILQSTLECFFDQTCLDTVQWNIVSPESIYIPILNVNDTHFSPNTTIGVILESLMIEQWDHQIQYYKYFDQCAPILCSYTFSAHNNALYAITMLISLFGGLSVAWKIIIPIIVSYIRNRLRTRITPFVDAPTNSPNPPMHNRQYLLLQLLKKKFLELNLFENELTWDNEYRIRTEILSTRIYILFLIISITILVIYTLSNTQIHTITHNNPSIIEFNQLQLNPKYSSTLNCPCQNSSIEYQSFITINTRFHQFCSSDFIIQSSDWFNQIYSHDAIMNYPYFDYRLFIIPQFQWLISFCILSNQTLTDELSSFNSNILASRNLQTKENIENRAHLDILQFRQVITQTFLNRLNTMRAITHGNGIVSLSMSNWYFFALNREIEYDSFWALARFYGDNQTCSCGIDITCTSQATIDDMIIPGFRVGCYPLEALLQSTLECLYNVTCINLLKNMYYISNISFQALDAMLSSPDMPIQTLINDLMIVEWTANIDYEKYYRSCASFQCTYSIQQQINIIYIVTTIIGFIGGLTVALKLIAPNLVKFIRNIGRTFFINNNA